MSDNINYYDSFEEKLNVITHGIGLVLSVIALILLIVYSSTYDDIWYITSFAIFGASLIVLYAASTAYHYAKNPELRLKLKIFDHAAIYVLIAGSYTPFALVVLPPKIGWIIFGISWGLAFFGIIFKLFYTGKYDKISTIAYVLMGWIIIFAIKPLIDNFDTIGLLWLGLGGFFYTIGAVFYSMKKLKYNHAIFHVFVLLGSFCHFISVFFYIIPNS